LRRSLIKRAPSHSVTNLRDDCLRAWKVVGCQMPIIVVDCPIHAEKRGAKLSQRQFPKILCSSQASHLETLLKGPPTFVTVEAGGERGYTWPIVPIGILSRNVPFGQISVRYRPNLRRRTGNLRFHSWCRPAAQPTKRCFLHGIIVAPGLPPRWLLGLRTSQGYRAVTSSHPN
jgi:hypothetical protein